MSHRALSILLLAGVLTGCQKTPSEPVEVVENTAPTSAENAPEAPKAITDFTTGQEQQRTVALQAKEALFQKLSSRLMEALQADGPAQAINVCRAEAPAFAEQVKRDLGVNIGRTSFKLRNATNPPPSWAAPLVEDRVAEPTFLSLSDGKLGALLPIMLQKKCELCHGPREEIADDVLEALQANYPNDEATGFQEGDLRGWFWIEVPENVQAEQSAE